MQTDLHFRSLLDVSALIQRRELSPVELARDMLSRIEALNPTMHAFATVTPERAMEQAERAESEILKGQWRGPLHGVPIAVKDLLDTRGVRTASGTTILSNHVPDQDATVVTRLEQAGSVLLGKLTLTEGAFAEHHPDVTPPVNPWSGEHWPGVSSSGSGVSVAAGLAYAALGTDTGGSIRFPSAANGITGLKPTWGRVSRHGCFALAASLDHIGPMARNAADCAAILGAIAGPDPLDFTALRAPVPDYLAGLGGPIRGLKVGVDRDYALTGTDPVVGRAFEATLEALEALGAELKEVRFPEVDHAVRKWVPACAVETALAHDDLYPSNADRYGPGLRQLIDLGRSLSAIDYARILELRRAFSAQVAALLEDVSLLAIPALALPIPRLSELADRMGPDRLPQILRFTAPFDLTGSPTLSLPCGFDSSGMPLGFQLIGPQLSEPLLLRAGHAFQQVTDWHTHHPSI